jgi:hypothetical protein
VSNDIIEKLAQALWEVPPYARHAKWAEVNEGTKYHYRARAAHLLEDFEVVPRGGRTTAPVRDITDGLEQLGLDMEVYGHAIVRVEKPDWDNAYVGSVWWPSYVETFNDVHA